MYAMPPRSMSRSAPLVLLLTVALLMASCARWPGWGDSDSKGGGSESAGDSTLDADSGCQDSADPDCAETPLDTLDLDGDGVSAADGDCDDDDPYVYPGAPESCLDDVNSDCDPDGADFDQDADGCTLFYEDVDEDGYGAAAGEPFCACEGQEDDAASAGLTQQNPVADHGDCDDGSVDHHPGAEPVCDGYTDDDCDGAVDLQALSGDLDVYLDEDADLHGTWSDDPCEVGVDPLEDPPSALCLCSLEMPGWPESTMEEVSEPDGTTGRIFPGIGEGYVYVEDSLDCYDDDAALSCVVFYADRDDDGYGDLSDSECRCATHTPYLTTNADDCDDSETSTHPHADESCDGVDSDCDGDENDRNSDDCTIMFRDADHDGYVVYDDYACYCDPTEEYLEDAPDKDEDCNDNRGDIHPDAVDCCGGEDNDCDGENPACDTADTAADDTCGDTASETGDTSGGTTP